MEGPEGGVHRSFYQLPPAAGAGAARPGRSADPDALRRYVREQTIGRDRSFLGPYGANRAVYCDHTASSKSLRFIEDYIRDEVLPTYSSTHTTSTNAALQTTSFRDEARQLVRSAVQASEHDAVLFCGTGATGAVHKLLALLRLPQPPLVLVGPHEHHSSLLPWREVAHQVVRIAEDPATGAVSLSDLQAQLTRLTPTDRPLVACFSAASNVTGLLAPHAEITATVHRHGGLCIWDYATAGPYTEMLMNPVVPGLDAGLTQKDALFFSPHKMIGGVQTPGVLVVKKRLVKNVVPEGAGGGTVFFVRRQEHRYLQDIEAREEGGTPGIVESIRAGLVLQLKEALGPEQIRLWDDSIVSRFLREARYMPQLALLGPRAALCPRLPVFSFLVATPSGGFLHHNFVAALLNDLFGVQTRGGCACAGPYAQDLLGIDEQLAARYEQALVEDSRLDRTHLRRQGEYSSYELLRPGFTRLTLSYLLTDDELEHAITALRLVCEHGWKLLPQYRINPETGEWRHHSNLVLKERRWLGDIRYTSGTMEVRQRTGHPTPPDPAGCVARARSHIDNAKKMCPRQVPDHRAMFDASAAELRWFLLPNEAKLMLHGTPVTLSPPFRPRMYTGPSRGLMGRRRAMSDSRDAPAASAGSQSSSGRPPSPCTPPSSPVLPPQYSGSLDRERGRLPRPPPAAADVPRSPGRPAHLKQRAMSVSCGNGADRRLSDTRFLAQELHNLFFSGARPPAPAAAAAGAAGPPSPTVPVPRCSGAAVAQRRSSPDGAESRTASVPEVPTLPVAVPHRPPLRTRSATAVLPSLAAGRGSTASPTPSPVASPTVAAPSAERRVVAVSVVQWASPSPPPVDRAMFSVGGDASEQGRDGLADSCDREARSETDRGEAPGRDGAGDASVDPRDGGDVTVKTGDVTVEKTNCDVETCNSDGAKLSAAADSSELNAKVASTTTVEDRAETADSTEPRSDGVSSSDRISRSAGSSRDAVTGGGGGGKQVVSGEETAQPAAAPEKMAAVPEKMEAAPEKMAVVPEKTAVPAAEKSDRKSAGPKWHAPPKNIFKKAAEAIEEFSMLRAGDRVLVCLSGGKDSLSLLHVLRQYRFMAASHGAPFELAAVTVDPQSSQYDPRPLIPYLAKLGVPYYYEVQGILQQAEEADCSSICSFCSRMKRGRLYAAARRQGYNVLAFGQHLDDISESFLMSVFHNGRLRTMKACYAVTEEDLRVIRPLIYVREKELRHFAESRRLPIIPENCPACFEEPKERHRVKQLLAQQEVLFPHLFESLRSALRPLYAISRTGLETKLFGRATGIEDEDADSDDGGDAESGQCGGGEDSKACGV